MTFVYEGPPEYRELCTFLQHPYCDKDGFGIWGMLKQSDREFRGWDQDSLTGMLIVRAGLWGDASTILSVVERFAPVYGGSPLTLRELHKARLGENTLGRQHLRGGAWKGSRPRLSQRNAYVGPEGSYLSAQLDLPDRGPTGVILNKCGCRSCEDGDWRFFDLFDPAGGEPDLWQLGRPYTPANLDSPRDLGVVEAATYLWAEELAR